MDGVGGIVRELHDLYFLVSRDGITLYSIWDLQIYLSVFLVDLKTR